MYFPPAYNNDPAFKSKRKQLRKQMTQAEAYLWSKIRRRALGWKFRRQFGIGHFIVDFYCHRLKLIVEIDGITHDSMVDQQRDTWRQEKLEAHGYTVVRYVDRQVLSDIEVVLRDILRVIKTLEQRYSLKSNPS